jgi:hypothetical protein
LLSFVLLSSATLAQPKGFKYQAVARGSNGALLENTTMNVRISVRLTTATGTIEYQETQTVSTNQYGLFSLDIGAGTPTVGTFNGINWSDPAQKFIQTEINLGTGLSTLVLRNY